MTPDEFIEKYARDLSDENKDTIRAFAWGLIFMRHKKELLKVRNLLNSIL